ncbi:HAD family hydrolase [Streptococcus azizii]|uniref:HAD family hydrolase n=1 Tax=Streptococcus azizii TaxID=1579424 RepID=A0ABX3ICS5_9STRE|nr:MULTISPECIES: HAD family hydrolase [Streptococcus]MBF0775607.1 HAD family hydrolase [Streptococcus sp. 19428wD3_AN2]ONK26409.1 HAD family hydrolase [Streptococcus azizii]ONK29948.1 HAD family hydrolase [Streptococcus azizii]TFU84496.1 HAD family hydrolase [Streptococcus sp. AN2]
MKNYKNYIFDFYGTLVDIRTDEHKWEVWNQLTQLYNAFGCSYRPRQLKKVFHRFVKEAEETLAQTVDTHHVEVDLEAIFIRLLTAAPHKIQSENTPNDLVTFGQLVATMFRLLSREKLEAYANTLTTLQTLKEEKARLFILSNAQRAFTQPEIEATGCASLMEKIYISSDVQMKKPEPAFLDLVMEENGLLPEETVMVGNDLTTDIAIAHERGIDAVLLNTFFYPQEEIDTYRNKGWHFTVIKDISELLYRNQ